MHFTPSLSFSLLTELTTTDASTVRHELVAEMFYEFRKCKSQLHRGYVFMATATSVRNELPRSLQPGVLGETRGFPQ